MAESASQTRISRYIGLYSAESTITHAKSSLRLFLGSALGRKLIAETLEAAGEQYFAERRDYQTDVETFFKSIRQYAPKSINMILSFTKGFLGRNGVKFDEYYWRDLKGKHKGLKGNRPLTEDQAPTPEILRKILQFMPLHGRAFALAASSSGMRLGESLRLKLSDIELDKEPVRIHIRREYTKSGLARPSFLSKEAVDTLNEWLKVREKWLQAASRKSHLYPKGAKDDRIFPFTHGTVYAMWHSALEKSGYGERDPTTKVYKFHLHTLRKYFRSRLPRGGVPVDVTQGLMGEEGYLSAEYRRLKDDPETMARMYKQGEPFLAVFRDQAEMYEFREETKGLRLQIEDLKERLWQQEEKVRRADAKYQVETEELLNELVNHPKFWNLLGKHVGRNIPGPNDLTNTKRAFVSPSN